MKKAAGADRRGESAEADELRHEIRNLQGRANRGIWILALFSAISIGASRNFDFLPSFPPHVHELLGAPPSPNMISIALVVYSFSAIILILSRMMSGSAVFGGIQHLGYLGAFFAFYHFADGLRENFWAVFAAGVTVLCLESYHMATHYAESIRENQERLAILDRRAGNSVES